MHLSALARGMGSAPASIIEKGIVERVHIRRLCVAELPRLIFDEPDEHEDIAADGVDRVVGALRRRAHGAVRRLALPAVRAPAVPDR